MLDIHGFVATCNATNFFMVKHGELWTSTGQYCMNGITRGKVIQVARESGIPCYEKNFSLFDVYGADEAFVTGTFGGLTPVFKVDGRVIGVATRVYGEATLACCIKIRHLLSLLPSCRHFLSQARRALQNARYDSARHFLRLASQREPSVSEAARIEKLRAQMRRGRDPK